MSLQNGFDLVITVSGRIMSHSLLGPVRRFTWHDPPDAAPRIGNVAPSTWDDVNMGVHHRLPCCCAVVDTDVESIGLSVGHHPLTDDGYQLPNSRLFLLGQVEQAGDMAVGNNERVALADWKSVRECNREVVLKQDARLLRATKRAVV
jgi:hypothetical protein